MPTETRGGFLISQIKQVSGRIFEKLLAQAGVDAFNGAQGRILYVLWQKEGIPIAALAKQTGLAKTTLTSMLDRMEQAELVVRSYDPGDRRQILISLTAKARELHGAYNAVSQRMNERFYAGMADGEIQAFENTLRRILHNLEESENAL